MRIGPTTIAAAALLAIAACDVDVNAENEAAADTNQTAEAAQNSAQRQQQQQQQQASSNQLDPQAVARARELAQTTAAEAERQRMRDQARREFDALRLVVDQSDRKVRIYRGDQLLETHDVAVGTEKNPTPIGEFAFNRVDINPRWVPPNSEWAEDAEPKPPGHPENPMGRARLVYKMPYTIHGTDNLDSLGKAVSHGSIRLANRHVIPLAEKMLKAGNSWQGEQWFQKMVENRNEEYQIPLDQDIPLTIQE